MAARLRRLLPVANRVGGALVILVGLYVAYYGAYELRLFTVGGNPRDAVIAAAGRVQGTLAGWVHGHGGAPWILLLVALVCGAAVWAWRLRHDLAGIRRRRSRTPSD